jgi:AcrR family transcriptional regulator
MLLSSLSRRNPQITRFVDYATEDARCRRARRKSGMNEADPRVKRTRKLIVEAFFSLMAEKSFHAISVQDIAERATVNRATFYLHFEDKYALMDWVVRDLFRASLTQSLGPTPRFSLDNLRLLVVTVCEFLGQFQGHCAPADRNVEPQVEVKVQEELASFLLSWLQKVPLASGNAASTARESLASLLSWAIFGAGVEWSRGSRERPAEEWARDVVSMVVGGVARVVALPADASLPR